MRLKSFITALSVIIALLCASACSSQPKLDAIAKLQQKIPFTIILPKYFPEGINPKRVSTTGPEKDLYVRDAEAWKIGINYGTVASNPSISITEENNETMFIQSDPTSAFLDINGTLVLEDLRESSKPSRHFEFNWNYRGISIRVLIYGYDKVECEKVVESMIPHI
jgi:hypothetical protein